MRGQVLKMNSPLFEHVLFHNAYLENHNIPNASVLIFFHGQAGSFLLCGAFSVHRK